MWVVTETRGMSAIGARGLLHALGSETHVWMPSDHNMRPLEAWVLCSLKGGGKPRHWARGHLCSHHVAHLLQPGSWPRLWISL